MEMEQGIGRGLLSAVLASIFGCGLGAILFCIVLIATGDLTHPLDSIVIVPFIGLFGWFFALPASLLIGAPLIWSFGNRFVSASVPWSIALAVVGGIFGALFGSIVFPHDVFFAVSRMGYACACFGAAVGGMHPVAIRCLVYVVDEWRDDVNQSLRNSTHTGA